MPRLTDLLRPAADASVFSNHGRGFAGSVDRGVVLLATLAGLACPQGPVLWYKSLLLAFAAVGGLVLLGAGAATLFSAGRGQRIQGPRRRSALLGRSAGDTALAAWIAACFAAWPMARADAGEPIGLVWSLAEAGGLSAVVWQTLLGVLVLDAWLYWKHRLLHTRLLFPFHRGHHVYRDPTPFAGFAVGPVESVMTFWPILLVAFPWATHFGPTYVALVVGFVLLNYYLHCGVTFRALEATLPRLFVNTSAFHNRHHANAEVNFGEALTLWDHICRTRAEDRRR
ncbi:sterol desaturase family protein [Nannocystis pusilla]|uniref:sterol desaturase family protein n=1 Tax=Nannocystis pusilla TaxID=889268 RepID=UPI003BF3C72B